MCLSLVTGAVAGVWEVQLEGRGGGMGMIGPGVEHGLWG